MSCKISSNWGCEDSWAVGNCSRGVNISRSLNHIPDLHLILFCVRLWFLRRRKLPTGKNIATVIAAFTDWAVNKDVTVTADVVSDKTSGSEWRCFQNVHVVLPEYHPLKVIFRLNYGFKTSKNAENYTIYVCLKVLDKSDRNMIKRIIEGDHLHKIILKMKRSCHYKDMDA